MKLITSSRIRLLQNQSLYLLITLLFLSGCTTFESALQFSVDACRQTYEIPQFPKKSPNEDDLGGNLLILFAKPLNLGSPNEFINDPEPSSPTLPQGSASLNSYDHSAFNWSASNARSPLASPLTLAQSEKFTDNLYYLGGAGLINKRSIDGNSKINLLYFEVPLHLVYLFDLKKGALYGGLGPYFAYGLGGKIKSSSNSSDKVNAFDKDSEFKRFDAGLGVMAGYQLDNRLSFYLAYEWGLVNISRSDYKGFNRCFSLNVMYPLDKIKTLF